MTTSASQPELKWNRYDAVAALIVALLAVAAALWFYLPKVNSGGLTVVISVDGQQTERVRLDRFTQATVSNGGYTLRVASDGEGVWIASSDCPGQDCVHTGRIRRGGQSIVCLPAQVVVYLEGAASPDAPDVIVG